MFKYQQRGLETLIKMNMPVNGLYDGKNGDFILLNARIWLYTTIKGLIPIGKYYRHSIAHDDRFITMYTNIIQRFNEYNVTYTLPFKNIGETTTLNETYFNTKELKAIYDVCGHYVKFTFSDSPIIAITGKNVYGLMTDEGGELFDGFTTYAS